VFLYVHFTGYHPQNALQKTLVFALRLKRKKRMFMEKKARIELRISPFEKDVIKANARELNLSVSDYLIRCGMRKHLPKPLSSEELEAWMMLKEYTTNFKRISNYIKNKIPGLDQEIKKVIEEMNVDLKRIRNGQSS